MSEFDSFFASFAMPSLMTTHGEDIAIVHQMVKPEYDPTTGKIKNTIGGTTPAVGIVEEAISGESDADGLRASGTYKVTTTTKVVEGDSVILRGATYRVKNVSSPNEGTYEFEARR